MTPSTLPAEAPDPGDLLDVQEIVQNALAASPARLVVLALADPQTHAVRAAAWAGLTSGLVRRALTVAQRLVPTFDPGHVTHPPDLNPLLKAVYVDGQVVTGDLQEWAAGTVDPRILQVAAGLARIPHVMAVPLRLEDAIAGGISFYSAHPFSEAERNACLAFARQVTLTLENARLAELVRRQVAQLQESRRLMTAFEDRMRQDVGELLHGPVQNRLLVTWHRLGEALAALPHDPARVAALLEEARAEIERIRERELEDASRLLYPPMLRIALIPAVEALAARYARHFGVQVRVSRAVRALDRPVDSGLPEAVRHAAYRVAEEGLGNAHRHASAGTVVVDLSLEAAQQGGRWLLVQVHDDGEGSDPQHVRPGLGLSSVGGRVEQLGGTWHFSGTPGGGASLTARLPLEQ